jgi:NitT/TauT family transport system ATP-binding protein
MSLRLAVRNLTAEYDAPGGGILPALGPVSFDIEPGSFVCLVGPSGCGKTTLIRILGGLQRPTHGEALVDKTPIVEPRRRLVMMFQESNLMPWRTVLDNIALPLELAGVAKDERDRAATDLLPMLGLEGFELAYPGELSGGMAQRTALGRLLIQQPDVLLLDEPFGALDALTREQLSGDLLTIWTKYRQTVLMVTHDIHDAVWLADRVLVMTRRPGRLIADIPVSLVRPRHPDDSYTAAFSETARLVREAINRA